mmetsp:Transcript_3514/g.7319  ORF Transcript_3514/g.7319 Transcript_3514/m.7319 type:complete len:166 (+) Transcript_3514:273-770(+)
MHTASTFPLHAMQNQLMARLLGALASVGELAGDKAARWAESPKAILAEDVAVLPLRTGQTSSRQDHFCCTNLQCFVPVGKQAASCPKARASAGSDAVQSGQSNTGERVGPVEWMELGLGDTEVGHGLALAGVVALVWTALVVPGRRIKTATALGCSVPAGPPRKH